MSRSEHLLERLSANSDATKKRLVEAAGKLLSVSELRQRLGLKTDEAAIEWATVNQLIGLNYPPQNGMAFPAFQLEGSNVRSWIPTLRSKIPNEWDVLSFLTADRFELDGQSFLQIVLRDPSHAEAMNSAADCYLR
jgi:hypothetical protein